MAVTTRPSIDGLILTPGFIIEDKLVYLNSLETHTMPRSALGTLVASLADDIHSSRVITAIDEAIGRAYG